MVGQIIPWNFPLLMAAWKLGPALATGCTVVLKPAEQTPLSALCLGELFAEAGFPDGVVNVVPGYGETAGAALAAHPEVDKIAFTGSTEVGKLIVQAAAGNLKKVSLELGGKSPNIVFDDADPSPPFPARPAPSSSTTASAAAPARAFMSRKISSTRWSRALRTQAKKIKLGPGLEPDTNMGPLVSRSSCIASAAIWRRASAKAPRPLLAARSAMAQGYFVEPTVMVKTNPHMKVVREEIFGPVVVASPFSDIEQIVAEANNTDYGLAAGVWTKDISKAHRMAQRSCGPEPSGSTATTSLTRRCRSADTSSRAGVARWATKSWSSTPK